MGHLPMTHKISNMTKRTLPGSMLQPSTAALAKKVRKLQTQVRSNSPEVKYHHTTGNALVLNNALASVFCTSISEGSAPFKRIGNRIRLLSIEVTGLTGTPIDVYLCKAKDDKTAPATAMFAGTEPGAFAYPDKLITYKHIVSGNSNSNQVAATFALFPFHFKKSFGSGLIVEWDGDGTGGYDQCIRNSIWLIFNNRSQSGNTESIKYNIKALYTDA